ncbi:large conductance mechanosensitive channel protein MscL [Hyphomonas sp.]|uniref:large conductance mechanosensitive channel protein MscL n=1 Tax=Hyphomonas sp. TaxID=87 RepID=UPI000C36F06D|nr:large conductance mechanosensitive channel protein MscL [Hyphomonas sp.]MAB10336.1 large conductance mechanosensitive channel protein MscL [Hyphomonas sp.]MAU67873.1 large conductance mechanosensitive channel protein MscL [Hyphomonas sp.]MBM58522.1 large conductance mechanosensitive channel protein MscL [Hyphomonas sp.]
MLKEFKEFAMKGNLVDMAVAFVMGGAFATLVTAFIQGVFLPLLSPVMGGLDFGSWNYEMVPATLGADGEVLKEAVVVKIGDFISAIISFTIVAFVMFLLIKGMNKMKKKEEAAPPPAPPRQEVLLEEIRNLLAKQSS